MNKENNKVDPFFLIIGTTGNIGSELIKILSKENVHIRAAVHSISKRDKILSLGIVDIVEVDFDKPSEIQFSILKDIDKVFLLTPNFDTRGISKILKEVKKARVKQVIYLSSDSVSLVSSVSSKGIEILRKGKNITRIRHSLYNFKADCFYAEFL